jgi:hypothetical protein
LELLEVCLSHSLVSHRDFDEVWHQSYREIATGSAAFSQSIANLVKDVRFIGDGACGSGRGSLGDLFLELDGHVASDL